MTDAAAGRTFVRWKVWEKDDMLSSRVMSSSQIEDVLMSVEVRTHYQIFVTGGALDESRSG